jgi:hypothetical protein
MVMEFFKAIISIQTPFNMVVLIVLFGSITGALCGVAKEIRKYGCHRQDIDFKRELVDRGLSAEEIERIVAAPVGERGGQTVVNGSFFSTGAPSQPAQT